MTSRKPAYRYCFLIALIILQSALVPTAQAASPTRQSASAPAQLSRSTELQADTPETAAQKRL